ncbi:hypothetical protein [Streptomyces sp. NPDC059863]|uniref:hypothetical protein n=1 Tax=unclassified Streptomyces TaxID=2593676 RepID=UPI00365BF94B
MRRAAGPAALAVVLSIGLSGCGDGEKKDYAIPTSLCGVPVDPQLLDPLLPPGKKIFVEEGHYAKGVPREGCSILIDGDVWLSLYGEWRKAGFTALDAAKDQVVGGGGFNTTPNGDIASWYRGAATAFPCRNKEWGAYSTVAEAVERDGRKANEEALKKFIAPYSKALAEHLPCEGAS